MQSVQAEQTVNTVNTFSTVRTVSTFSTVSIQPVQSIQSIHISAWQYIEFMVSGWTDRLFPMLGRTNKHDSVNKSRYQISKLVT